MKTVAIIPARYDSTRFPGKPLARLGDKTVIEWVYQTARQACDMVVVATDDKRIADTINNLGGTTVISSHPHSNGTSRVAEALQSITTDADLVINVQADEPFIKPEHIQALIETFDNAPDTEIGTLITPILSDDYEALTDPNQVKVVIDHQDCALYFSRAAIPYTRGVSVDLWPEFAPYYGHLGVYAYRPDVLDKLVTLEPSPAERAESLEQLRWLYYGYRVRCAIINVPHVGIDTPEDLAKAQNLIS